MNLKEPRLIGHLLFKDYKTDVYLNISAEALGKRKVLKLITEALLSTNFRYR